jgi:hypothetical protein
MKSKAIVMTASLVLVLSLGTLVHAAPAAFANPCSSTTVSWYGKSGNNGNNCNGGDGGDGGKGGYGGNGAKGGYGGDAANGGNTGNTAAASSSKTQGSGDIKAHGGDANGGKGGDGGEANGGYGGSVFVCNSLEKAEVSCK